MDVELRGFLVERNVLLGSIMRGSAFACLALLSATAGLAQTSGFLLGFDYAQNVDNVALLIKTATDASGSLYILSVCTVGGTLSCLTKVSSDGQTLWQDALGFEASGIAVDGDGETYVATAGPFGSPVTPQFLEKVSPDGRDVLWQTALPTTPAPMDVAIDPSGYVWVVGADLATNQGSITRIDPSGDIELTAALQCAANAVRVDGLGRPFVFLNLDTDGTFAVQRLAPDGSASSWASPEGIQAFAPDQNGNLWTYGADPYRNTFLTRYDAQGNQTLQIMVDGSGYGGLAVDPAGNAYVARSSGSVIQMKNSLAACLPGGAPYISVFASDGSLLQSTYLPGAGSGGAWGLTVATNSAVYAIAGPVIRLSPNNSAQTVPLVCMGSAATYNAEPIAPGEIVTLFGSSLGPAAGIQTQATMQTPFPTLAGGVQVTFDGRPAPLLWVQDAQINAVAPWELTAGQTTQVCVSYNEAQTNCLTWPVVQLAPGVFTVDGTYAAALNQDGTVNTATNPAQAGSVVSIFATGMGPINPSPPDGSLLEPPLPVDVLPMAVVYNAGCFFVFYCTFTNPTVSYQGPASLEVAGLTQISFQAPPPITNSNATSGGDFWLTTGAQSNQFSIYVAQ
jgi:uncharacterized protein (TIGR03437 family)